MRCRMRVVGVLLLLACCTFAAAETKRSSGWLAADTPWQTPYYVTDSGTDGPTLLIVGGVHGNEPAGYRAAEQIRHWPIVKGKLVVIPKANVPGLRANTRFLPGAPAERRDLNRNFPGDRLDDGARGEIAHCLWQFVRTQRPDWVLDLHEGYEFRVSHKPPKGTNKSVGSSVIFADHPERTPLARRMQAAANALVTDPDRKFVLLSNGVRSTALVGACVKHLGAHGMILETTFARQPISLRTRQHRAMVNVAMLHLGMVEHDCVDVFAGHQQDASKTVAMYDGPGTGGRGVGQLAGIVDQTPGMTVHHLGAADIRPAVLQQFDAIVFPGGSGSKQAQAIGPAGRGHVRQFVRTGGGYLGVCAGAYLCSAHYSWSLDLVATSVLTGPREIEGVGTKQMWYRGNAATVKMQLTADGQKMFPSLPNDVEVRYHNGPIVSPKEHSSLPDYTPLAYFRSEHFLYEPQRGTMVDTPAIVSGEFHQGRVIAISPHPEAAEFLHPIIAESIRWITTPCRQTTSYNNSRHSALPPFCAPTTSVLQAGR